jgi:ATP-dependent Clp protease ATP-binding subunit ClpC
MSTPVQLGDRHLVFDPPAIIPSKSDSSRQARLFRYLAATFAVISLLVLLSLFVSAWPLLSIALWQQGNVLMLALAGSMAGLVVTGSIYLALDAPITPLDHLPDQAKPYNLYDSTNHELRDILGVAAGYAAASGSDEMADHHLLLALLEHRSIRTLFYRLETIPDPLHEQLASMLTTTPGSGHRNPVSLSSSVITRLINACQVAYAENYRHICPAAVLLAYAQAGDQFAKALAILAAADQFRAVAGWEESLAAERHVLRNLRRTGALRLRGTMNRAWSARPTPFLDQFSIDLTLRASYGYIRLRTGYQTELTQIMQTMSGGSQRNVVLIGEPDSDLHSILDSIATLIIRDKVPQSLHDVRLLQLDLTAFLALQSNAEQSLQKALQEASDAGNVVLVLPDASLLSKGSGTSFDPAQILGAALRNRSIQVLAVATAADYRKHIEQQPILKSELQAVRLHTMTPDEVITHLETELPLFEHQHNVMISYTAVAKAAALASRYLPEVAPPGSTLQLLEAAAKQNTNAALIMADSVVAATEALTNVPIQVSGTEQADALLNLEATLHERVIGQNRAVRAVATALRRSRAGLQSGNRPIGTFMFVGPTGVGKTELAKALQEIQFGDPAGMVRLDMSEYADPTAIYRLIGAPAGSAEAITDGGTLTQPLRERSYRLVLLDELEKAHPDVLNLFLQILDDGRVTDNSGRVISFVNSIIIATSNAGAAALADIMAAEPASDKLPEAGYKILEQSFRPEFLNRFDAIVPFTSLDATMLSQITRGYLQAVQDKLRQQEYLVEFTDAAIAAIAQHGYDPRYGARPLRRTIERDVEGRLAELILQGALPKNQAIRLDVTDLYPTLSAAAPAA